MATVWNKRRTTTTLFMCISWSEDSLRWSPTLSCFYSLLLVFLTFLFKLLVKCLLKTCPFYTVGNCYWILRLPQINREEITSMNSHFLNLKAHKQCCSHCLNFKKGHITTVTVSHRQNIVLILDTHKGESDLNSRQFIISNCETDILARYNIEQIKGLQ